MLIVRNIQQAILIFSSLHKIIIIQKSINYKVIKILTEHNNNNRFIYKEYIYY